LVTNPCARGASGERQYAPGIDRSSDGVAGPSGKVAVAVGFSVAVGAGVSVLGIAAIVWAAMVSGGIKFRGAGTQAGKAIKIIRAMRMSILFMS
jgi:hypothetical protein